MWRSVCVALPVLFIAGVSHGQGGKISNEKGSLISVNAGVSIPFLCFGSANLNKSSSGFAKPGYSFNLKYGYLFTRNAGLEISVFYSHNPAGNSRLSPGRDGYRYLGIMTGPLFRGKLAAKLYGDITVRGGIAKVFTPRLSDGDAILLDEHEAAAFIWGGGIGLCYDVTGKAYLTLKADHANLKPQFHLKPGETGKTEQHIVAMDISAGVGIKF